jgi:hypothetical protein
MRVAVLLGVAVLAASCSSGPKLSRVYRADGVSVRYPDGWDATSRPLTHVTSPVQVLAVASYRLPRSNRGDDGCEPKAALDRRPADGAFIYGWEFSSPQGERFPPRPRRFSLTGFERFECLGPSYRLQFRDAGRLFNVHVSLGPDASGGTRKTVLRILDSLRVRAGTRAR